MITRQIWRDTHPNTPITQQPRLIHFTLRCQTTPDSHKHRNPATRFSVRGNPTLGDMDQWIRDCPHWWQQSIELRAGLEDRYRREHGADFIGLLSIEYGSVSPARNLSMAAQAIIAALSDVKGQLGSSTGWNPPHLCIVMAEDTRARCARGKATVISGYCCERS